MTTAPRTQGRHEQPNVFGDPWNEPATTAVKIRTTLAFVAFLALIILFAATASGWVSDLAPEPAQPAAVASKANGAGRTAQSPVPVLAPSGMTAVQADEFAERLRSTPDGYFSRVSYPAFDMVVNGSLRRSGPADSALRISETETGISAMFARDGADYQVEFSCRGPGSEAGASCITEADVRAIVETLAVIGEDAS
jgi:hypothetical protein